MSIEVRKNFVYLFWLQNDPNTTQVSCPIVGLVDLPSLILSQKSSYHIRIIFVLFS